MFKVFILFVAFVLPSLAWADEMSDKPLPPPATAGIDYLIDFVKPTSSNAIDISHLEGLIDFVASKRPTGEKVILPERLNATPAFYEFEIQRSFKDILALTYHPDIPLQMVSPGSVRLSFWVDEKGNQKALPSIWNQLDSLVDPLAQPIVAKGIENEEITPDITTGAYYRSLLDRSLILFSRNGHKALISLARQRKVSDVGKKGLILGADESWNYFFSGEKGLTKTGMGWVDSHIYDTFSVVIYYESDADAARTKCCLFKWLRAGWAGLNMVKSKHIRAGFERFARDVKRVMESPHLPGVTQLANTSTKINQMSKDELQSKMGLYLEQLVKRLQGNQKRPHKWITQAVADKTYVAGLTPPEMRATLFLETLKYRLGLLSRNDVAYLKMSDL